MGTLGQVIDRRPGLPADGVCEAALSAFIRDESCRVLAVVANDRPIGVLSREPFLARMETPGAADRPLREVMDPEPLIADADEDIRRFVEGAAQTKPAALQGGFVVTRGGAYLGVCDLATLIEPLLAGGDQAPLATGLAEGVREPIAHALAAAECLKRLRLPEGASVHLDTIGEAGRSALALLDVASDLQKAHSGRLEIAAAARRLQELMDRLDLRWRGRAEAAGVTLLVSYDGQPDCAAMVDETRLLQVFDALIGHAIAHAGGGVIEASLKARPGDNGVALTGRVRDNDGVYAAGYLAALFDHDRWAEGARAGIQMGLMLAQRAMSAMAGRLAAVANAGSGATVSFDLVAAGAEAADAQTSEAVWEGPARSAHILVVDDNATNRMVVEALCEMFHCSTESVVDGVEAVEAAKAGRFDLILMDIKMPRMDGVTAAREIRRLDAPAGKVPIIALTANADPDEIRDYLAAGMCSVVEKPIKPERLLEALEEVLSGAGGSTAAAA